MSNIFLGVELDQRLELNFLFLSEFLHLLLDILQFFQGLLRVLVDGLLLLVLAHAVAAVPEDQPDDLSVGLADLVLQLLDRVVERGVAGVGHLPVGVRLELQQQLDELNLALPDGSDEQRLVGGFSIDLHLLTLTNEASRSSSNLKIFSDSSLPLFSIA